MRKLTTLRTIAALDPIPDADAIEVATIDGWKAVVKKGEFAVGERVIYIEVDAILPASNPTFDFLNAKGSKDLPTESGYTILGFRLRTIRLRGQLSQGLVIKFPENWTLTEEGINTNACWGLLDPEDDLSEAFGIEKYEKPITASMAGKVAGNWPSWLPKTDQERVQNLRIDKIPRGLYLLEEKVEGSSMTIGFDGEKVFVGSRSLILDLDQVGNTFVDVAKESGLLDILPMFTDKKIAIRGELVGPGIQGNIYGLTKHRFYTFDIWFDGKYLGPEARAEMIAEMMLVSKESCVEINTDVVFMVPFLKIMLIPNSIEEFLDEATGQSRIADVLREGVVFKQWREDGQEPFTFKVISPEYLLKQKD